MPDPAATPIDLTLTGQPLAAQGYMLAPVARMAGWEWGSPAQGVVGAFVRLTPTEVHVTAPDGGESTLTLANSNPRAVGGMFAAAALVAIFSSLLILLAQLWGRRKPS